MTARSIGSATITFGMVHIPVNLFSTGNSAEELKFHLHHDEDSGRLKQQYVCHTCDQVVDREHTVRGCETGKGQYVILSAEELGALEALATNVIAIEEYVPIEAVRPLYVEKSYYLSPDDGSGRPFALLSEALAGSGGWAGHAAIARYSARGREHVVALMTWRDRIVMHELRYQHEIKDVQELPELAPIKRITADELALAWQIIDQHRAPHLDLAKYRDGVRDRTIALIEGKAANGEAIAVEPQAAPVTTPDLEAALRASIDPYLPVKDPSVLEHRVPAPAPTERYPGYTPHDSAKFQQMTKVLGAATSPAQVQAAMMLFVLDTRYHREDITVVLGRIEHQRGWDLAASAGAAAPGPNDDPQRIVHRDIKPGNVSHRDPLPPKRPRAARARKAAAAARKPTKKTAAAKRARRR